MPRFLFSIFARWSAIAGAFAGLAIGAPGVSAQSRLLEPDLSGMFTAGDIYPQFMMRDSAHGWNYFSSLGTVKVDGVTASSFFFRISDSGLLDTRWTLPPYFQVTNVLIAADGVPFVQAYVKPSPTFEKRWYRLNKESAGAITPAEVGSTAELPPRDSMRVDRAGLPLLAADGSQTIVDVVSLPAPPYTTTYLLRKRSQSGNLLWEQAISGVPHNLAIDAQGRSYVVGEALTIAGKTGNLVRILADGRVDTGWSPAIDSGSNVESLVRVVDNRIIVADRIGGNPSVNRIASYDLDNGGKLSERFGNNVSLAVGTNGVQGSNIADDGSLLALRPDGRPQVLNTTRNDASADHSIDARLGSGATANAAAKWRDGIVVGGRFDYWFDGRLYRNLMRLDASFRPDPTWTPALDGTVSALAVDAGGTLIVGGGFTIESQTNLVRFTSAGALDITWTPSVEGKIYKILPASDGMLFVSGAFSSINGVSRGSIARFHADGSLDRQWASQPTWPILSPTFPGPWGRDGIYTVLDAGDDGVYFVWEDGSMNGSRSSVERLSRGGSGTKLTVPDALASGPSYAQGGGSMMRDPVSGAIYAIASAWQLPPTGAQEGTALIRLLPPNMAIDTAWTTVAGPYGRRISGLAYQTDTHVYVCRSYINSELRRFDKLTGKEDPDWRSTDTSRCNATLIDHDAEADIFTLMYYGNFSRLSAGASNEPRTVVEYYSGTAQRFFITGRPNEIAQLDALPQRFRRTGMQFDAETARVYTSDAARTAICRFYSPPEAGGSNTHFYGRDSDCTLLKRFSWLRYEGFDFRAGAPVSDAVQARCRKRFTDSSITQVPATTVIIVTLSAICAARKWSRRAGRMRGSRSARQARSIHGRLRM